MQCADLDRYLEAFLDARLGRTRVALLRRHLNHCAHCQRRIADLRRFERQMQGMLQGRPQAVSVWTGLDLDLVRSPAGAAQDQALPLQLLPRPLTGRVAAEREWLGRRRDPARRPVPGRVLGPRVVLAVLAFATASMLTIGGSRFLRGDTTGSLTTDYRTLVEDSTSLPVEASDPQGLKRWLSENGGLDVPLIPLPSGFSLAGARIDRKDGLPRAIIVYRHAGNSSVLTISRATAGPAGGQAHAAAAAPMVHRENGITRMTWPVGALAFDLISPDPPEQLFPFETGTTAPPAAAPKSSGSVATPL